MLSEARATRYESAPFSWIMRSLVLLFFMTYPWLAKAQLTTGTITGTVGDPSGAAVPGASIAAKNLETGIARSTVTGPQGRYELVNLPVGNYEVTASMAGFQTSIRAGIALTVGRTAVVDHTLQVGEVTQSVTVTGEASLVETTTATVSQLVDERRVAELPLNNRDLTQLVLLQPGVIKIPRTGGGTFSGMGATVSVAGARGNQNLYLLDGVSNADHSGNPQGASGSYIGAETVKEFQIITNNYSAEHQSAAGAIVSAVTKSGTNVLHGSGFWTLRNDNLDAAKWEDNTFGGVKQDFKRNQFGGSLGGPIARDRTFFFGSYEGLRERLNATDIVRLFSDDARRGILPGLAPITIDPQIMPYLELYPRAGQGNTLVEDFRDGTVRVAGRQREPVDDDFVAAKFDHQFAGEKAGFLTGTYNWDDSLRSSFGILGDHGASGTGSSKHTVSAGHTSVLSPTTLNEFKFGFSHSKILLDIPLGKADTSALAFNPELGRMGEISPSPVASLGYRVGEGQDVQEVTQFKDGLSLARGNHSYRVGGELRRVRFKASSCSFPCTGTWPFSSVANFLRNIPQQLDINLPGSKTPDRVMNQVVLGAYFQDNWQVRPSLTLNLGLRYEFATVPDEAEDRVANLVHFYDPYVSAPAKIQAQFPNEQFSGTIDKMFTNAMKKSFGPRFGFAWAPGSRKASLRGGFGMFYDFPTLYHFRNSLQVLPPFVKAGRLLAADATRLGRPLRLQPNAVSIYGDLLAGQTIMRHMVYEQSNTYSYRWSLTLQREFGGNWVASAGYTGSRALHLWHQNTPNVNRWIGFPDKPAGRKQWPDPAQVGIQRINPNFSELRMDVPDGVSYFHGLSVGVQQRLTHGLQLQLAYNFSKTIDGGSGVSSGGDMLLESQRDIYYWDVEMKKGRSQFDIRHSFTSNFSYDLPGQGLTGLAGALGKGWQVNGIITLSTGAPLTVRDGSAVQNSYIGSTEGLRANLIPGGDNNPVLGGPDRYYDTSQFVPSVCQGDRFCRPGDADYLPGFYGNVGRSTVSGPGLATVDFSTLKNFNVTENHRIQFRGEFFNLLNRPNFGTPDMTPWLANGNPDANAARISSTLGSARQIQFGLRYIF
jgi:hypothetical protein